MYNRQVERQIKKIYEEVYKKVFNKKNILSLSRGHRIQIEETIAKLSSSKQYEEFAKKFAKELSKKGLNKARGTWRKFYEAAKKSHYTALPKTFTEYEEKVMKAAIEKNFKMIKSIPKRMSEILQKKYTIKLIEEVAKGTIPRSSFRKMLEKHGIKQAKLIARTETAKLQTAISEDRARNLGSVAYIWRSSNDLRTRPSHKEMNGVVVFWMPDNEKPLLDEMRGNAGEFPNCRCDTFPILDEDDLTKSNYSLYNYKTNKIVSVSKAILLKYLKQGEIK